MFFCSEHLRWPSASDWLPSWEPWRLLGLFDPKQSSLWMHHILNETWKLFRYQQFLLNECLLLFKSTNHISLVHWISSWKVEENHIFIYSNSAACEGVWPHRWFPQWPFWKGWISIYYIILSFFPALTDSIVGGTGTCAIKTWYEMSNYRDGWGNWTHRWHLRGFFKRTLFCFYLASLPLKMMSWLEWMFFISLISPNRNGLI